MNQPVGPIAAGGATAPVVGASLPHESAVGHVTGAARYVDDLWPDVAHVAHAWPVQAPHAHARVLSIDASAARSAPGVLAVLTGDDVPGENDIGPARHDEPLFPSEVCFAGQAVAWVIAETEEAARLAAAAVRVEYEALPAILSIEDAIAAASFLTDGDRLHRGDAEAALRDAPHRLDGELHIGGQEHFYLETNAALAYRDHDGGLMVHSSTQHPSETQEIVARVLGLPKHAVVVQCLRMGGAFGGKEVQANAWAAVAALAATTIGRPVRVRLTRQQDMVLTGKRHPFLARFRVGFEADGALRAVAIELFSDGGWSLDSELPGARPRDVPHRQLLPRAAHGRGRPRLPHEPCLAHRLPWLRWPAGHAGDRGDRRSRRAGPRSAAARRAGAQLLPRGRHDALRPGGARIRSGSRASGPSCRRPRHSRRAGPRSPRSMRPAGTSSAGWR